MPLSFCVEFVLRRTSRRAPRRGRRLSAKPRGILAPAALRARCKAKAPLARAIFPPPLRPGKEFFRSRGSAISRLVSLMCAQCVARTVWLDKRTNAQMRLAKGMDAPQTDISPVARTRPKGFRQAAFLECAGAGSRFHNGAHGHSSCSRNIEKTPLRKVEMALARASPSTGDGGHGGVDEREGVFAAWRIDGGPSAAVAGRRRGAAAEVEAPTDFPPIKGIADARRRRVWRRSAEAGRATTSCRPPCAS